MKDTCQLNDFLKGLKPSYSKRISAQGKRIMFLLDERNFKPGIAIEGDGTIIGKILDVLVDNAVRNTDKGYIKVGYKVQDNNVLQFFVEDTGSGIDAALLSELNNKLSCVEGNVEGVPASLIDVGKLVSSLGGKMFIESQKNMGATVYFSVSIAVPVECESHDEAKAAAGGEAQKLRSNTRTDSWQGHTILIAEDEVVNYMFLEVLFEDSGATLLHASDGQQAIDLAREHPEIEIILMDIKMPNVNGLDATKAIKAFRPQTPIIAQTAYAMQDDEYKALQAGCNEYISKPIDAGKLMAMMRKYLCS